MKSGYGCCCDVNQPNCPVHSHRGALHRLAENPTRWELRDGHGRQIAAGDERMKPPTIEPRDVLFLAGDQDVSIQARLKILEDRADTHAEQISTLMDSSQLVRVEGGPVKLAPDHDLIAHNLDALLLWSHPEAWNIGGSPEERLRMRTVLDQIHRAVQQAHRGERVETPDEVSQRQATEPPPTVVG